MKKFLVIVYFFIGLSVASFPSDLQTLDLSLKDLISFARKSLGNEILLSQVESITYYGLIGETDKHKEKEMVLYLKKPYMQRLDTRSEDVHETLASDGYEGYFKRKYVQDEQDPILTFLPVERIKKMRNTTIENLCFFNPAPSLNTLQYYAGLGIKRGRRCYRLVTEYGEDTFFVRFIDINNGKLLATKDGDGTEIIEFGEIVVSGIRFPQSLEAYSNGKIVSSITFTKILVNADLNNNLFVLEK